MPQHPLVKDITQSPAETICQASPPQPVWSLDFTRQSPASAGLTFTRASNAGYYDKTGNWVIALSDTLRINHHPSSGQCRGFLSEEARTNYLLNSATPADQTISLSAGTYTLWMEGSGSATCAAGTAIGSGFGLASAGTPRTFTVTAAGTVVFTLSGSLTRFQCENGSAPSSFITTLASAATRSADVCSHTAFPFNPSSGTILLHTEVGASANPMPLGMDNGAGGGSTRLFAYLKTFEQGMYISIGGAVKCDIHQTATIAAGTLCKIALAYGAFGNQVVVNGQLAGENTNATSTLSLSAMRFGCRFYPGATNQPNGHLSKVVYFNQALTLQQLNQLTAQ